MVFGCGKSPLVASKMMSFSERLSVVGPKVSLYVWSGFVASPSRNSGGHVAGAFPSRPASEARSVPWPLPVALRLPNKWNWSPVARLS